MLIWLINAQVGEKFCFENEIKVGSLDSSQRSVQKLPYSLKKKSLKSKKLKNPGLMVHYLKYFCRTSFALTLVKRVVLWAGYLILLAGLHYG